MSASLSFPVFGALQPVKGHGFDVLLTAQAGIAPWRDAPAVTIRRALGNRVTVRWERGILETATAVTGPWSESASIHRWFLRPRDRTASSA